MARFNFTNITLTSKADITTVMNNFNKIEELGALKSEVDTQIETVNNSITNINNNLGTISSKNYSIGTTTPSGGSNGDIYDQYF